ncbi:hypothetical protein BDA96_04G321400 [Sorghum bicolor]|uniref:Uncharacterized protein n=1 Tax=Sorghum bicolor TaxID=4558 RepID=A0A921R7S7_SORBI|nr:hypothetical protein BDA96_04G321400 [Sorghum bicolor]
MGPGSTALATGHRRGWKAAAGLPLLRVLLLLVLDLEAGVCASAASTTSGSAVPSFWGLSHALPLPDCVSVLGTECFNFHVQTYDAHCRLCARISLSIINNSYSTRHW